MSSRHATALALSLGWLAVTASAGAEVFVYPRPGVGQEQMRQDQYECYTWAKTQTGFDPSQPVAAAPVPAPQQGGAVRGGARGAAVGAIGGAIGGDAGKGAAIGAGVGAATGLIRQGSYNREAAGAAAQSQAQQQSNLDRYERSYAACMAGRGYQVR
jgi:hypothetical protein